MSRTRFFTLIVGALAIVSCNLTTTTGDMVNSTVPPDARAPAPTVDDCRGSVRYKWSIETAMTPAAYASWVTASLRPRVDVLTSEPPSLLFGRYTGGDLLHLRLSLEPTPAGTRIHAVFTATPD